MAVITADGIVGKVLHVYHATSEVLLINDQSSGVGAILDKTRLQGILMGTPAGELVLGRVMSDETVPPGEMVLTSGGDGIFPKGLPVGTVAKVSPGSDLFLNIHVRPTADLSRLEEVLVVTKIDERQAQPEQAGGARAIDILAARLPSVPSKPESTAKPAAPGTVVPKSSPTTGSPAADTTKTANPALPGSEAKSKPKPAPRDAASSVAPDTQNTSNADSSAGDPSASRATAAKVPPKAVNPPADPKPQTDAPDTPH
jgi:rod shape-determining protein MreC